MIRTTPPRAQSAPAALGGPSRRPESSASSTALSEKSAAPTVPSVIERVSPNQALKTRTGPLAKPRKWVKQFVAATEREVHLTEGMHDFRTEAWRNRADTRNEHITSVLRQSDKRLGNVRAFARDKGHLLGDELREIAAAFYGLGGIFKGMARGAVKATRDVRPYSPNAVRPKTLLDAGIVKSEEDAVSIWSLLNQRGYINVAGDVSHPVAFSSREHMQEDLKKYTTMSDYVDDSELASVVDVLLQKHNAPGRDLTLQARTKGKRLEYLYDRGVVSSRAESENVTRMLSAAGVLTKDFLPRREKRFDRKTEELFQNGSFLYRTHHDTDLSEVRHAFFGPPAYDKRLSDTLIGESPIVAADTRPMLHHVLDAADRGAGTAPPGYVSPPVYKRQPDSDE